MATREDLERAVLEKRVLEKRRKAQEIDEIEPHINTEYVGMQDVPKEEPKLTQKETNRDPFSTQGATEAFVRNAGRSLAGDIPNKVTAYLQSKLENKKYEDALSLEHAKEQTATEKFPVASVSGSLMGAAPWMGLPTPKVGAVEKIAPFAAKAWNFGKEALASTVAPATYGAAINATKADKTDDIVPNLLEGAETGAETGVGFFGVGKLLGSAMPTIQGARDFSENAALKATIGQGKRYWKNLFNSGKINEEGAGEAGKQILRAKTPDGRPVIGFFDTTDDIAQKLSLAKKAKGQEINTLGDEVDRANSGVISGQTIADELRYRASPSQMPSTNKPAIRDYNKFANEYQGKNMSFREAQGYKDDIEYKPLDAHSKVKSQDVANSIKSVVGKEMESGVESTLGSEGLSRYQDMKKTYGSLAELDRAAKDRSVGNLSNRNWSPTDYLTSLGGATAMGGATGSVGMALAGLGAGAVNHVGRLYGNAFMARSADSVANLLEKYAVPLAPYAKVLKESLRRGLPAFTTTTYLLQKQDPKFGEIMQSISNNEEQK